MCVEEEGRRRRSGRGGGGETAEAQRESHSDDYLGKGSSTDRLRAC